MSSINTGFFVSAVPPCGDKTNCETMKKFKGLGFFIRGISTNQEYVAYGYKKVGEHLTIELVKNVAEMPFEMPYRTLIRASNIWPQDGNSNQYLFTTYDENDFAVIFVIKQTELIFRKKVVLYILSLRNMKRHDHVMEELDYIPNGFIQRAEDLGRKSSKTRKLFAIFHLGNSRKEFIREYISNHTNGDSGKQHFSEEVCIEMKVQIIKYCF